MVEGVNRFFKKTAQEQESEKPAKKSKSASVKSSSKKPPQSANHTYIKHVSTGDQISGVYYVTSISRKTARNGNIYSDVGLRDKTGISNARAWNAMDEVESGDFVEIVASVEEYMGLPQIIINEFCKTDCPQDLFEHHIEVSSSISSDQKILESAIQSVREGCASEGNSICADVLEAVFVPDFMDQFCKACIGENSVFSIVGGALRATVMTLQMLESKWQEPFSLQSKLILQSATALHYVGATSAYELYKCVPHQTTLGCLFGLKQMSLFQVMSSLKSLGWEITLDTDSVLLALLHCIMTMDDRVVKAQTPESILLSGISQTAYLSAHAVDFINKDRAMNHQDEQFTAYDSVTGRRFYLGNA